MGSDVESDIVEFILHQGRDESEQLSLADIPAQDTSHRSQHLCQGSPDRLGRILTQLGELGKDVLLKLIRSERCGEVQARLDDPDGFLSHFLLVILHELHERWHQACCHDVRAEGRAELVEVFRDGQANPPGAVLCGLLDDLESVLPVFLLVEHVGHHQSGVDTGNTDGVLGVFLRQLLVDLNEISQNLGLLAHRDQIPHLVCSSSSDHRGVIGAESGVGLSEGRLLVLVCPAVSRRKERACGHSCSEEVALGRQSVQSGNEVVRSQVRSPLHNPTEGCDGLITNHRLLLSCKVLERSDEQLIVPVDVI
mmetsp:Transcript_16966/g.36528  ORF Transcript_16966/g.36528 Transcript_16966/m.36528 type:complete len:309 (-) Transcript_16966:349-1275(-)